MPVVITIAPVCDRKALLDMLFTNTQGELDLLPDDTSESLLERIGDGLFIQIDVDEMLYGFVAVIDNDSIIMGKLPEFEDVVPLVCSLNVVLTYVLDSLMIAPRLFFTKQLPVIEPYIPTIKSNDTVKLYSTPLLVNVNNHIREIL